MRMRRGGGIGVVAALIALAALAWGAVGATAGPHAKAAAVATYHLRVGDRVLVKGTPVACVVQNSNGVINFACVDGGLAAPTQGSYAVGIADKGVDLAKVAGNSAKLLKLIAEPSVSGPLFPNPTRPAQSFTIAPSAALLIGGTHIFCAVEFAAGVRNVTCGVSTLSLDLQFPAGSYITSLSATFAILGKAEGHGRFTTVSAKSQP